ncbi:MAG: cell division protein FtsZ [Rickettsiales bacterium]|jgi:cell division protein FtsZ|nr:cell division protein FtsZ [Rickettsiales bacterium]
MQITNVNNISLEDTLDGLDYGYKIFKPKILVFGVGGGGVNVVNSMVSSGDLSDVDFVVANTDYQSLEISKVDKKILLGKKSTNGMGAGADSFVGKNAAEESLDEIEEVLSGMSMVFITAGMGGGTGTGAAPVIAKKAKDMNLLVAAIVTKPFLSEGILKMQQAERGIEELRKYVDTLIVVPNQNLFRLANQDTKMQDSLKMVDNVLRSGVRGITDLITKPGFINLDFADVKTVMKKMGKAMMGMGEASGPGKAVKAVEEAISNPLLDNVSIRGAKGIIINITGSPDITLFEHEEATKRIKEEVNNEFADIIIGNVFDENMVDTMRISIFATGIDDESSGGNSEQTDDNYEKNYVLNSDRPHEPIRTVYLRSRVGNGNIEQDTKAANDEEDDFFDMGEPAHFDGLSPNDPNKQKKTGPLMQRDAKFKEDAQRKQMTGGENSKKGFFSFLFGKKTKDSNEHGKNEEIFADDDLEIDLNLYNTPTYLRNKK